MSMNPLNIHLERRILANRIRGLCSDIFLITICYIFRTQILAVQMLVEADAQLVCSSWLAEREVKCIKHGSACLNFSSQVLNNGDVFCRVTKEGRLLKKELSRNSKWLWRDPQLWLLSKLLHGSESMIENPQLGDLSSQQTQLWSMITG